MSGIAQTKRSETPAFGGVLLNFTISLHLSFEKTTSKLVRQNFTLEVNISG